MGQGKWFNEHAYTSAQSSAFGSGVGMEGNIGKGV